MLQVQLGGKDDRYCFQFNGNVVKSMSSETQLFMSLMNIRRALILISA